MRLAIYSRVLPIACAALLVAGLASADSGAPPREKPELVLPEEYLIYDRVVQGKFLTSQTTLVLIDRQTVTRLTPQEKEPPTRAFFDENEFFEGAIEPDIVTDFIAKARRSSRLEARFNFGVSYRFVFGQEPERPEVSLAPIPTAWPRGRPAQGPPSTVGTLGFSRVGFNRRETQALVYVGDYRPDGTGAGFLILLRRTGKTWEILNTEVVWVAQ
ncbi:MAG: hypothetical protein ACREIS_03800 [Nitrospiraceae bacterium]